MITFDLGGGVAVAVIEPTNIQRMKDGHALRIRHAGGEMIVCFTPDMEAFTQVAGIPDPLLTEGLGPIEVNNSNLTIDRFDAALKATRRNPEVYR